MNRVRGRFAPSPSGEMHLGNAWTALLAWLQVRSLGGDMVLRMEDLDPNRSRPAYAAQILEDLKWLGLDWDEGPDRGGRFAPYHQDARRGLYEQFLHSLAGKGLVYPCYCTRSRDTGGGISPPWRRGKPLPGYLSQFFRSTKGDLSATGKKTGIKAQGS